jgi:hypothetical protein
MILESRKWRLLIRLSVLLATSLLMLGFVGPVSYALQDDKPTPITAPQQLSNKEKSLEGRYADAKGAPTLNYAFTTKEFMTTYYWIPVAGYDDKLFIRTEDPQYLFPSDYDPVTGFLPGAEVDYAGKILSLKSQANADKLVEEWAGRGIIVDKESAMVLSHGETPSAYRPMVPVIPALAWMWLAALIGLVQIVRGRSPRHKLARAAIPTA